MPHPPAIYIEKKEEKGERQHKEEGSRVAVVGVLLADLNSCYLILMQGTCFWYQNIAHTISYILVLSF